MIDDFEKDDEFFGTYTCSCGREYRRERHLIDNPVWAKCNQCHNKYYLGIGEPPTKYSHGREYGRDLTSMETWGWGDIIRETHEALTKLEPDYRITQIKEKFGGLRYYTDCMFGGFDSPFESVINGAERRAYKTCEQCGAPGVPRSGGWIKTLCDEHADGREPSNING